jgi:hypothetical protein
MDIHAHARPHLEVHSRSKGHSSVAGCAYRLGLRLFDERAGVWHDYRKRELGEEIVRTLTIAPPNAPAWATDPAQLWNKVELAEKRKDGQVARDYRIPIPHGLSDQDAGDLAGEMARFICDELHVPVSLGLHRDADRDALGNPKPSDKQGFHAHLYFPTRPVLSDTDGDNGKGKADISSSFFASSESKKDFGPKLHEFSKMHLGAAFIELLNCKWSELATDYARKTGSDLTYQFKSYKRLGVNITPQPTLGRSATAMERRGIYTNKGDSLREALVMAQVYEKAHAAELNVQHAQAVSDRAREGAKTNVQATTAPTPTGIAKVLPRLEQRRHGVPVAKGSLGSMTARFHAASSKHMTQSEREALERALFWVHLLERILAIVSAMQVEADRLSKKRMQAKAELLTAQYNIEQSREHRALAHANLRKWERANSFKLKVAKITRQSGSSDHQKLQSKFRLFDDQVQSFKRDVRFHQQESDAARDELNGVAVKMLEQEAKLQKALGNLRSLGPDFEPRMLAAASPEQKALLVALVKKFEGGEAGQGIASDESAKLDVERKSTLKM